MLCVSAEEGPCQRWDSSGKPMSPPVPINPHMRPGFCLDSSCGVILLHVSPHPWVVTRTDGPQSVQRGRNPGVPVLPSAPGGCITAGFRCRSLLIWAAYRSWGIKLFLSSSPEWKLFSFVNETEWAKCNLWRGRAQILYSPCLQNKHRASHDPACSAAACLYNKWYFEIIPWCIFKYQILLCF